MTTQPPVRATDREREDTVEALRAAFAAGCLDESELAERAAAPMPPSRGKTCTSWSSTFRSGRAGQARWTRRSHPAGGPDTWGGDLA
jgi:hypothetical protein